MEKTVRTRNKTLDVYKGILISLVVIRHALQYSVRDEGGILTNCIWAVQMPGFMLISGYLSVRKIESLQMAGERLFQKAQHYALPFFSWFVLVDMLLLGKFERNLFIGLGYLLTHVDSGLWFLWVLFVLSVIATLTDYMLSNKQVPIIKAGSVILICFGMLLILGLNLGLISLESSIFFIIQYFMALVGLSSGLKNGGNLGGHV